MCFGCKCVKPMAWKGSYPVTFVIEICKVFKLNLAIAYMHPIDGINTRVPLVTDTRYGVEWNGFQYFSSKGWVETNVDFTQSCILIKLDGVGPVDNRPSTD